MAEIIRMPKLSDTMTEGVVSEWHKKIGDQVDTGDLLADIETDKATLEFESPMDEGVLLYIGVEAGGGAPVNSILAILGEKGENIDDLLKDEGNAAPVEEKVEETATTVEETVVSTTATATGGFVKASPLAKKMAQEKGIDISTVSGTGPDGRIVKKDIEEYKPTASSTRAIVAGEDKVVPHSMMRKAIARTLTASKFSAPHFYLTMDIDMDNAIAGRKGINEALAEDGVKVSFNHLVIKAASLAMKKNPKINSLWGDTAITYKSDVNIGIAVAVEDGLVVPVLNNTEQKSLAEIAVEANELGGKAKEGKLKPDEMQGNTFTISNLGMAGIESFTSIIYSPASCILAVGAIRNEPVVKNGEIVVGNRMKVTMSCDHRSVDGAVGSDWLQTFKQIMENPLVYLATSN